MAFASRIRIHATWQAADNDVRRLKANQDKARRQGKLPSDRIAQSLAEVQEVDCHDSLRRCLTCEKVERRAMEAKREFDHVSRLIKSEVARFEKERIDDFKKSLENLLNGMITRQREVTHYHTNHDRRMSFIVHSDYSLLGALSGVTYS
jgi:sorting nexin-1/2